MQHGHPSLSTVHHHSALSAWKKLAQYVAQGWEAVEFSIAALLISDAVDLFVHLERDRQGRRVVTEICEVAGWNGAEVQLNRIFVAGPDGRGSPNRTCPTPAAQAARPRVRGPPAAQPDGWWACDGRPSLGAPSGPARPRRGDRRRRLVRPARSPTAASAAPVAPDGSTASTCAGLAVCRGRTGGWWWARWPAAMAALGLLGWMTPSFVGLRARRRRQLARSEASPSGPRCCATSSSPTPVSTRRSASRRGSRPAAIRDEVKALYVRAQRGDLSSALALRRRHGRRRSPTRSSPLCRSPTSGPCPISARCSPPSPPRPARPSRCSCASNAAWPGPTDGPADRRHRRLLRRSARAHEPRLHGAVRHGHRPDRADRRRPGRAVGVGDDRPLGLPCLAAFEGGGPSAARNGAT